MARGESPRQADDAPHHAAWPRTRRITRRVEFTACYEGGRRFHTEHFLLFVRFGDGDAPARMGMAVSRKVGGAVVRNRVRRLLRECFRHAIHAVPDGTDVVVTAKRHAGGSGLTQRMVDAQIVPVLCRLARRREPSADGVPPSSPPAGGPAGGAPAQGGADG